MALLDGVEGGRESFPIVLGFQHFNLLLALFNLSLNYCLLSMLVANMHLFMCTLILVIFSLLLSLYLCLFY